ncbi:NAD-dependent epimerase/dehydratase family protein [Streptomyces sp. NPDC057496]|uniref:NAD-dependent epimerase/dehydratase family protein n=1 Tax=Streptomyces sp. NPDC057496 TaxID=3346149 RepID=UPI0036792771
MNNRSVLVTGAHGYLGSVLIGELDRRGYRTTGIDNGLMSDVRVPLRNGRYVAADLNDVADWESLLADVGAVVHLAAIVGDPACGLDHNLAWETNYLATVRLTEACRRRGVTDFVFASTCSNYGLSVGAAADIHTALHPQSVYAESKIYSEHHLLSNAGDGFNPRILRLSTLYGRSPRMRFDLAVNVMTAHAVNRGEITVHGGTQWRPFLHVSDAADAFVRALEARPATALRVWNCGSSAQNHRIDDIARIIAEAVPDAKVVHEESAVDSRDYFVNFTSIQEDLGFVPARLLADEVRELASAIRDSRFGACDRPGFSNYETLRAVMAARSGPLCGADGSAQLTRQGV